MEIKQDIGLDEKDPRRHYPYAVRHRGSRVHHRAIRALRPLQLEVQALFVDAKQHNHSEIYYSIIKNCYLSTLSLY